MTSLNDLAWEHPEPGSWVGTIKKADGGEYRAIFHYRQFDESWEALCMVDGSLIHRSEHNARHEARLEVVEALQRAIDIREAGQP